MPAKEKKKAMQYSGSIKFGVFLDQLSDCQLLKKDPLLCSRIKPYVILIYAFIYLRCLM